MDRLLDFFPVLMGVPGAGGAAGASGGSGQLATTVITFGLVILIFYFLIIRPQNKRSKETKRMLAEIKKGDRVVTAGGIRGVVQAVREETVVLKVDDTTKLEFSKGSVSSVLEASEGKKESKKSDSGDKKKKTGTDSDSKPSFGIESDTETDTDTETQEQE
jgi:preprotein translocase subunit YajC